MGELHLEILVDRLLRDFKVQANIGKPQVAYRETITVPATVETKFVKQTGGKGQYAHVVIEFSPAGPDKPFEFENRIQAGVIPKEFIKPVADGIRESMASGAIAGFPVINIKAALIDGSFHEVDSSELAFRIAGSLALQDAMRQAKPVLMEPMMDLEVVTPDEYLGAILGDLAVRPEASLGGVTPKQTVAAGKAWILYCVHEHSLPAQILTPFHGGPTPSLIFHGRLLSGSPLDPGRGQQRPLHGHAGQLHLVSVLA